MVLDNKILVVPKNAEGFVRGDGISFPSKYRIIGAGFFNIPSFGDGINEKGLMGSSNFFPKYASFLKESVKGKLNMTVSNAFDYLLSQCESVEEVKKEAEKIRVLNQIGEDTSTSNHFFFMDTKGDKVVLEPKDGILLAYENPYGVLTNSPEFPWHTTNLKNFIQLQPENVEEGNSNGSSLSKLGEGTGMRGLPGDFTPPSRFIRAAYFVSTTAKDLERNAAILQGFRVLSQFDIPNGSIVNLKENHQDQTLYTSIMDTKEKSYHIKCHDNITLQSFYLNDFIDQKEIMFIDLDKSMTL